jgi:hypothetical protein
MVLVTTVLALVAAACGGADEDPAATSSPAATSAPPPTTESASTSGPPRAAETTTTTMVPAEWRVIEIGPGVKPALSLDGSGAPAIAFLFEQVGEGFVAFARAAEGWEVETVREGYFYGPIDLSFDPQGVPYIAYHDHQADNFDPELGDLTVASFDGVQWTAGPARDDGHDGWDSTIVIDPSGTLHAAGVDPSQFGREDGIEYYVDDGSGWTVRAIGSGPIQYRFNVALALGPGELPALSYYNDRPDAQDLMFATFDGSSWNIEAVDTDGDVGKYPSLAFDAQGRAHISYFLQDGESSGTIRHAVQNGTGWAISDVAQIAAFEIGNARRNSSVAIDSTGTPHIAFSDTESVWYAAPGRSGWDTQLVASSGALPLGQLVSLVIDGNDVPHVGFYEVTRGNPLDGVVIYATTL